MVDYPADTVVGFYFPEVELKDWKKTDYCFALLRSGSLVIRDGQSWKELPSGLGSRLFNSCLLEKIVEGGDKFG